MNAVNDVILTIPVRLESKRFPNKALSLFNGKTLIENAIEVAKKINFVNKIVVASGTDDVGIENICKKNNIEYLFIKEKVSYGTERVLYVKDKYPNYNYYMTLPVDEPAIIPDEINDVWDKIIKDRFITIATLYSDFYNEEDLSSINSCKIITSENNVIYTSRAVIPASKNGKIELKNYKKHVGVFFFSNFILTFYNKKIWSNESFTLIESLEQNDFLPYLTAYKIKHNGFGIDLKEDIKKLEERIK
jgi:3-deoxy-manno-octulosonate cytidylyltransferase (CMP-KDO synthetase)